MLLSSHASRAAAQITLGLALASLCAAHAEAQSNGDNGTEEAPDYQAEDLAEMSLEELLSMQVTTAGRRAQNISDAPGIVRVVTAEEIRAYGANNLREVIVRLAHVYPIPNFINNGGSLSLRGDSPFPGNHILYLIDGRPMRSAMNGGGHETILSSFPVTRVARIEVIRGPGSVLYGSTAYSGVINIITTGDVEGVTADVRLAGGSYRTGIVDGTVNYGVGKLQLSASVYGTHTRGWTQTGLDSDDVNGSGRTFDDRLGGNFSLDYEGLEVDVFAGYGKSPSWRVLPVWERPAYPTRFVWANVGYGRDIISDKLRIDGDVTVNHLNGAGDVTIPRFVRPVFGGAATVPGDQSWTSILGELALQYTPIEDLNFTVGATVENLRGEEQNPSDGMPLPLSSVTPFNELWFSAYVQGEYKPIEQLTLIAGLQLNKPENVSIDFAPRAGLIYRIRDDIGMKLLWSRAFRNAYPFERYATATGTIFSNPDLQPEHAHTIDFEVFYGRERLTLTAVGFYTRFDQIDYGVNANGQPAFENLYVNDPRQSAGVELEAKYEPIDGLHTYATYSFNQVIDGEAALTQSAPHSMGRLGARYAHPRGIEAGAFYTVFGMPANDIHYDTIPVGGRANLLSLHASVNIPALLQREDLPAMEVGLYGTNVLNSQTQAGYGFIIMEQWQPASLFGELRVRY